MFSWIQCGFRDQSELDAIAGADEAAWMAGIEAVMLDR